MALNPRAPTHHPTAAAAAATPATRHTIAIEQVAQTLLGAQARGLAIEPLLQRAGISPALLDSPLSRVTIGQYAALSQVLRHQLRDELWGLCSRPLPLGSFAAGCHHLIGCRTLGDALRIGLRHYRLLMDDFTPRLVVQGAQAQVLLVSRRRMDARQSYAQRAFAFLAYGLACWLVARRIPLSAVDYPAAQGGQTQDAQVLFQAPVQAAADQVGWHFEARWLELPVVQTPDSLADFLKLAPMPLLIRYRDESSLTERIRRILRRHLADESPSLEKVSQQLAMTPQTLRRHLREEGHGFREIRDDLRRDAAIEYLARPDLALPAIAALLGFSEASTFHRAFKHWTGVAPGEYRQTLHQEHADGAAAARS